MWLLCVCTITGGTEQTLTCVSRYDQSAHRRTQRIIMVEGIHSVADGGHLYLVYAVCDVTIRRHTHVFKRRFST